MSQLDIVDKENQLSISLNVEAETAWQRTRNSNTSRTPAGRRGHRPVKNGCQLQCMHPLQVRSEDIKTDWTFGKKKKKKIIFLKFC